MPATPAPPLPDVHQQLVLELSIGPCAITWSAQGLYAVRLLATAPPLGTAQPERLPSLAGPSWLPVLAAGLRDLLTGGTPMLDAIPLDLSGIPPFHLRVYEALRKVQPGERITYSELAGRAGNPKGARAVGQAMRHNRHLLVIPCHRVLPRHGGTGGFSAPGGTTLKEHLLHLEQRAHNHAVAPSAVPRTPSSCEVPQPPGQPATPGLPASAAPLRGSHLGSEHRTGQPRSQRGPREKTQLTKALPSLWEERNLEHATRVLLRKDRSLGKLISSLGPCTLTPPAGKDAFAALCEAIIYQQLAGAAARAITRRFCLEVGGGDYPSPSQVLAASEAQLQACGLSPAKRSCIVELATQVQLGALDLSRLIYQPDADISQTLRRIRGIGPWTVQMLLMFWMGRPDVLPCSDLGIRKAMAALWTSGTLPSSHEVEAYGQRWAPWRTVASWYLWRSLGGVTIG